MEVAMRRMLTTIKAVAVIASMIVITACQPTTSPTATPDRTMQTGTQLGDCEFEDGNVDGSPCMFEGVFVDSSEYRN
jgi:uncharacterized protein with FMN-binding domain